VKTIVIQDVGAQGPAGVTSTLSNGGGQIVIATDGSIEVNPNPSNPNINIQGNVATTGGMDVTGPLSCRDSRLAVVNSFVLLTDTPDPPADGAGPCFWYNAAENAIKLVWPDGTVVNWIQR
jgi:hypothetical protein